MSSMGSGGELEGVLSHVEINVLDLDESVGFYGWFLGELGYHPHQSWDKGRSWRLGSTYIVIVEVDPKHADETFHRRKAGLNHLAFHAPSAERVDQMRRMLEERSVQILYGGPESGDSPYALFFEGPERLKLEYVWEGSSAI